MQGTNTVWSPDADKVAQFTGGPTASVIPYLPTYAATMVLDPEAALYAQVVTTSAVGNASLSVTTFGKLGQQWQIEIANDSGGARTITFGAGFRPTAATVVGTASKSIIVDFTSNGSAWLETGRSTAV